MADNLVLSNDALGFEFFDQIIPFDVSGNFPANETSAHGLSASGIIPLLVAPRPGRVVDVGWGVVTPALSASGFVSGTVDATIFINGVGSAQSTVGAINMIGSAGQSGRTFVNTSTTSTAFLNPPQLTNASAQFNAGDEVGFKFNARSVGSAAAGTAGLGLYGYVRVRYAAQ